MRAGDGAAQFGEAVERVDLPVARDPCLELGNESWNFVRPVAGSDHVAQALDVVARRADRRVGVAQLLG